MADALPGGSCDGGLEDAPRTKALCNSTPNSHVGAQLLYYMFLADALPGGSYDGGPEDAFRILDVCNPNS